MRLIHSFIENPIVWARGSAADGIWCLRMTKIFVALIDVLHIHRTNRVRYTIGRTTLDWCFVFAEQSHISTGWLAMAESKTIIAWAQGKENANAARLGRRWMSVESCDIFFPKKSQLEHQTVFVSSKFPSISTQFFRPMNPRVKAVREGWTKWRNDMRCLAKNWKTEIEWISLAYDAVTILAISRNMCVACSTIGNQTEWELTAECSVAARTVSVSCAREIH